MSNQESLMIGSLQNQGEWVVKLMSWAAHLSLKLFQERDKIVSDWIARGGHEFGDAIPPKREGVEFFPRWKLYLKRRDIVAVPAWGYYDTTRETPRPTIEDQILGQISEETAHFSTGPLMNIIAGGISISFEGCCRADIVSVLGLKSEVEAWRAALLDVLQSNPTD